MAAEAGIPLSTPAKAYCEQSYLATLGKTQNCTKTLRNVTFVVQIAHLCIRPHKGTSANFENNFLAVNCFMYALFLMAILQTSYYYSYTFKLSLYGFNYWIVSVIILQWLFKYRYLTIPLLLNFDCLLCSVNKNGEG